MFELVSRSFLLSIPDSNFWRLGHRNRRFCMDVIAKNSFSWKSSFQKSGIKIWVFLDALRTISLISQSLKTKRFFMMNQISHIGFGYANSVSILALQRHKDDKETLTPVPQPWCPWQAGAGGKVCVRCSCLTLRCVQLVLCRCSPRGALACPFGFVVFCRLTPYRCFALLFLSACVFLWDSEIFLLTRP